MASPPISRLCSPVVRRVLLQFLIVSLIFLVLMSTSSAQPEAKTLTLSPGGLNAYLFCGLLLPLSDFTRYVQDVMIKICLSCLLFQAFLLL